MSIKELQTRIALKYDSYAAWTSEPGKDLVLLEGEIGLCEIPTGNDSATTAPTVLFKVGNGTKKFSELNWASARAADVFEWAKSKTVAFNAETKKITFKNAASEEVHNIDLSSLAVKADTDDLLSRVAAIETSLGESGSVANLIAGLGERLDTIEGEGEGSIKKAAADTLASAQAYADQAETDAVATAKTYTDTEVAKDRERLTAVETKASANEAAVAANASAITKEAEDRAKAVTDLDTAYKAADKAINDKIGGEYSSSSTVHSAIVDAKLAGTNAAEAVTALAEGAVATNASNIATLRADLTAETTAREQADADFEERIAGIELFFEGAAKDEGEGENLKNALDTLVEIQDYITNDGSAAAEMVKDIQANANDITALKGIVEDGGTLEVRVDAVEAGLANAESDITDLKAVTEGYTGAKAIQTAVNAAQTQADKGVEDAAKAQSAAEAAQREIDALELVVNNETTGLAATKDIADNNTAAIAGLTTDLETLSGNVTDGLAAIHEIITTGDDANAKLRSDIYTLQQLTGDAAKGNEKLYNDLAALSAVVDHETTGLAATNTLAVAADTLSKANQADITEIKADYLKAADQFILRCGTASTVTHVEPESTTND